MKHTFFAVLISLSVQSYGQLSKNTCLVGGSGSFNSSHEHFSTPVIVGTEKQTSVEMSATVGYFLLDKLSAGARPFLSFLKVKSQGGGTTSSYQLAIGPFARYYFLKKDKAFNLLADISYQFGFNHVKNGYAGLGKFNTLSVMAGTAVFFTKTAALEILLGYKKQAASIEHTIANYNSIEKGLQVSVGFALHLKK